MYVLSKISEVCNKLKRKLEQHILCNKVNVYYYYRGLLWSSHDRMVVGFTTTCAFSDYHH